MWQKEWPTQDGMWWLYGWCFSSEKNCEPKLHLVEVCKSGECCVTNGHFLYREEGTSGIWQKAVMPDPPKKSAHEWGEPTCQPLGYITIQQYQWTYTCKKCGRASVIIAESKKKPNGPDSELMNGCFIE